LNRSHNIGLLGQKCITQISGPLNVVGQTLHDIGQRRHGLNAWIPRLFLDRFGQPLLIAREILIPVQPLLQLHNLQRIG
jgi:hypothetical protein